MRRTLRAVVVSLVLMGATISVLDTISASASAAQVTGVEVGPWPENPAQSALYRDGGLYAGPFEAIGSFVALPDGTIVLNDPALGLLVAVGGFAGQDPDRPELAGKAIVAQGVGTVSFAPDGAGFVVIQDGEPLGLLGPDGTAVPLDAIDDPRDAIAYPGGGQLVCGGDGRVALVVPTDQGAETVELAAVADPVRILPVLAGNTVRLPDDPLIDTFVVVTDPTPDATTFATGDPDPAELSGDETVVVLEIERAAVDDVPDPARVAVSPRPDLDVAAVYAADPIERRALVDQAPADPGGEAEPPAVPEPIDDDIEEPATEEPGAARPDADASSSFPWWVLVVPFLPFGIAAVWFLSRAPPGRHGAPPGAKPFADRSDDDRHGDPSPTPPSQQAGGDGIDDPTGGGGAHGRDHGPAEDDPNRRASGGTAPPAVPSTSTGGSVDMVPADPCDELRRAAATAEEACGAARQQAAREEARADQAEAEAASAATAAADAARAEAAAERDAADAQRDLDRANGDVPDDGDWVEDERGRITGHDLDLKNAASKAAHQRWQRGEITAAELEAEWKALGDRDAIEALRAADDASREQRRADAADAKRAADAAAAEALRARAEADSAATAARQAAETARSAADAASSSAAKACADADAKRAAADACEKKMRAHYARQEADRRAEAAERAAELEALENDEADREVFGSRLGDDDGRTLCCSCGTWVIYGGQVAGMAVVWGTETTKIWAVCTCNSSVWVEMTCTTTRWGLGLGGEGNTVFGVAFGVHASEIPSAVEGALNGFNWDFSLGASAAKAFKGAEKGTKLKAALDAAAEVASKGAKPSDLLPLDTATLNAAGEAVRNVTKGLTKSGAKSGAKQGVQQTEGIRALVIPAGAGVQFGAWLGSSTKIYVTDYESCGCIVTGN